MIPGRSTSTILFNCGPYTVRAIGWRKEGGEEERKGRREERREEEGGRRRGRRRGRSEERRKEGEEEGGRRRRRRRERRGRKGKRWGGTGKERKLEGKVLKWNSCCVCTLELTVLPS